MDIAIVVLLLFVGIVFFVVEIFLLPGTTLAGIAGTAFLAGAIYYAYSHLGPNAGNLTLLAGIVMLIVGVWLFLRSRMLDRLSLKTEITGKNDPLEKINVKPGDIGVTASRLATMGKVKINGHIIDAKTNGEFLDQGVEIVVVEVLKTNVLVEKTDEK